jgi:crossover junction endodeoxyribonuclease RuvC
MTTPHTPALRVVGVDLSLTGTGLSDGHRTLLIRTSGHRGDTLGQRRARLRSIVRGVMDFTLNGGEAPQRPDLVVVEAPSLGTGRQSGTHDRAGLWWLLLDELLGWSIPVAEVPPAALKKYATGKGNANKGAMIDATARRFPHIDTAADDNRCDALWLAHMGLDQLTGAGAVPAAQRLGLSKVTWPELAA